MPRRSRIWLVAVLAPLCACASQKIVDDTPDIVTVRYDGLVTTLNGATATANRLCAAHGKTARLRAADVKAALERYAHFECVSG